MQYVTLVTRDRSHDNAHDLVCDLKLKDTRNWLEDHGNSWNQDRTTILLEGVTPLARRQWNATEYCRNAWTMSEG
jgi:hypothetical protein